ncbi:hypothetical protein B0T21DRAFT_437827 [Apiosordaria backusii]|uniref:Uncharacterized protein n=1 Tax=Apiosordaria backusii TaxID=314023 RepID=A0AA40ED24_9PEZI|nr:hypothetical protein B0T21DRAFT_437827 [Apiosordaria backusii]
MPYQELSSMTRDRREAGVHWRCFPLLHSILPVGMSRSKPTPPLQLRCLFLEPTPGRTIGQKDQSVSNIAIADTVAGWLGPILLLRDARSGHTGRVLDPRSRRVASSKISSNEAGMFGRGGRDLY